MLTAAQCRVVAFLDNEQGEIICRDCAANRYGPGILTNADEGMSEFITQDVAPLIEYELSSYWGEILWERITEDVYYRLAGRWTEASDRLVEREFSRRCDEEYPCDDCGKDCV